jgi:murein DD-endopeptidase MepM/ murein hydrolase activator NlpD
MLSAYAPPRASATNLAPAGRSEGPEGRGLRIDGLALAALIIAVIFVVRSIGDRAGAGRPPAELAASEEAMGGGQTPSGDMAMQVPELADAAPTEEHLAEAEPAVTPWDIRYPYDDFWITQGLHGYSYGHMAIDLKAGKGAPINSPIQGRVAAVTVDEFGNTTLVIENQVYVVTLLHGNYTVQGGQALALGEVVGSEWNNGYTLDMDGQSCRGRDCGFHTHLNVYSKLSQSNVNPLEVMR